MTARQHHYISQFYLKGFTKGQSKNSKLTVIDFKEKKHFESNTRNVAGVRDFNRVDIAGLDQNAVEKDLSDFESKAAYFFKLLEQTKDFSGERREYILNFIALLAVRTPERREHLRQFKSEIIEKMMALTLQTKERWESQIQFIENDKDVSVTYEDAKDFFERKEYRLEVAREWHIHMEMEQIDSILPYLDARGWILIEAPSNSMGFITSDNPVCLKWVDDTKVPPFYRNSPGFGLKDTIVFFPVSQGLALLGMFELEDRFIQASDAMVANYNSLTISNCYKQVYAPKLGFKFQGKNDEMLEGRSILSNMEVRK